MKRLPILFALLAVSSLTSYAQCDNPFYKMEKGHHYEMEAYNGKDKLQAKVLYTVTDVAETDNGYEATVSSQTLDKKGKVLAEGDLVVLCEGGQLKMDIQRLLNSMKQLQNTEGMEVDVQGDHLIIPADLNVGETLPESTTIMTMKLADNNTPMSTMNFTINNRTVAAQEDVTTPAGTFPCYKITYDMDMNMKVMGMGRKTAYTGAEWLSEGVGMVRNEQYDEDGKLNSYSVLVSYE